jgi:hypothetical protein
MSQEFTDRGNSRIDRMLPVLALALPAIRAILRKFIENVASVPVFPVPYSLDYRS